MMSRRMVLILAALLALSFLAATFGALVTSR